MNKLTIKPLTGQEVSWFYETHLQNDFPPDERKPLTRILAAMDCGTYLPLGAFEGRIPVGYAFFVKTESDYLLDYFAVFPDKRNQGYGSQLLQQLKAVLNNASSILVEVENPDYAESEEEAVLRSRRLHFYLRCGFQNTHVNANTFGVNYLLLEQSENRTPEETKQLYQKHYRAMLPDSMFREMIIL